MGFGEYMDFHYKGENMTTQKSKPAREWYCGSVRLSAWEQERTSDGETYTCLSFKLERRYRNKKGDWHSSPWFFKRDLLDIETICHAAYESLSVRENSRENNLKSAAR